MNIDREILLAMTDQQFDQYCRNAIVNASIEASAMAASDNFSLDACKERAMKMLAMNEEFMAILKERNSKKSS